MAGTEVDRGELTALLGRWGEGDQEALKRTADAQIVPDFRFTSVPPAEEILAMDEALRKLESIDPRKAQVVERKFFGGLTTVETAESLDISVASVERDWQMAKAWLYR